VGRFETNVLKQNGWGRAAEGVFQQVAIGLGIAFREGGGVRCMMLG
jgi:hypothetical protein